MFTLEEQNQVIYLFKQKFQSHHTNEQVGTMIYSKIREIQISIKAQAPRIIKVHFYFVKISFLIL